MNIYKFTGMANQVHAIGERENFKVYIRAENRDTAIEKLYSNWEHITIDSESTMEEITWKRVNSDINGNPRYVCHYLTFMPDWDKLTYNEKYEIALKRSRTIGGRKFNNKQYGGGILFCTYSLHDIENSILDIIENL